MRKTIGLFIGFLALSLAARGQVDMDYQTPSEEILQLADVPLPPSLLINSDGTQMILRYRNQYKSIAELSEKEMRLAGIRTNPTTNISSRTTFYNNLELQKTGDQKAVQVKGLPPNARLANFSWSPDENYMAFTHTHQKGTELWILDINVGEAKKLTDAVINANLSSVFSWFRNSKALLIKQLPDNKPALIDKTMALPMGPRISVNDGKKAQNRTYQDLLKDKTDEANFESLSKSKLVKVSLDGEMTPWAPAALYYYFSFSPDGQYVLLTTIEKPFSYLVPYYRFPTTTHLHTESGKFLKELNTVPLIEDLPKGFMAVRTGKRDMSWRSDHPATLVWVEALDEGDPAKEVDYRDELFQLKAPFEGQAVSLVKTINRFSAVDWGTENLALIYDRWWNTRNTKTYLFNPADNTQEPQILFDRNYQDRYNDPGDFVKEKNQYGKYTLSIVENNLFLIGDGYTAEGQKPFIDTYDVSKQKTHRLLQIENKEYLETIRSAIDLKKGIILTRKESPSEYPNYFIRNIKNKKAPQQITFFENPFKGLTGVHKEVMHYEREDGLPLSGTLYLPANYDFSNKERLPLIMWAYPREYKDKSSAGQVTTSSKRFIYPSYGSPVFWVMKGYAILDAAAFPIVGEGDKEPNNTFVKQLVANAQAAISYLDSLGYSDPSRCAIGGHSYGAFMTANLLSHSNLFAAGIARSGAYNRTLTPFGFQAEERSYWEAPNIYYEMSPFMHADKMKTPLLIIHGQEDNNSGTYTMQSERYFNALKGLGATVRLVLLPKESHSYRARESILHLLWEQDQWLENHVKNKEQESNN
jgi:dipeptidyl aminopeptidase/acylaminoacyl peptidase